MRLFPTTGPRAGKRPRPAIAAFVVLTLTTLGTSAGCSVAPAAKTAPDPSPAAPATGESEPAAKPEPAPPPAPKSMTEAIEEVYAKAGQAGAEEEPGAKSGKKFEIKYPQPPDGKWLVDEEGRQYFVIEVPKVEGQYLRLRDGEIQIRHGQVLDLAGETDDTFLAKIYKVEPMKAESDEPTPEEVAEVERLYTASELPASHSLTFRDFGAGLPRQGQWRNGFDIADMNDDGHPDVVHGPPRRAFSGPAIFLGDGAGNWTVWRDASWPQGVYAYGDAEAADFNRDGEMDVAFGVHLSGLTAMLGDGKGHFTRWAEGLKLVPAAQAGDDTFLSRAITSTDWDGDGLPDLIALSEGPRHPKAAERSQVETPFGVVVYPNHGDGTWGAPLGVPERLELFGDSLDTGDFDGDGRPDLVTGTNALGLREIVFLNRGEAGLEVFQVEALRPLSFAWSVAVADFDGDGLSDFAVSTTGYRVREWWQSLDVMLARKDEDGRLTFERRTLLGGREVPDQRLSALAAGDLDGDGDADLVALTEVGEVRVFLGDGRGGFTAEEAALNPPMPGCRGYHVQLADLDGEPGDEVVAAFAGEKCPGAGSLRAWKATAN